MSVEHITGDALSFERWNVLIHCANCTHTMSSGIALEIKKRFPAAFEADGEVFAEAEQKRISLLGTFSVADVGEGRKIVNLYGQLSYGRDRRHLNYEAFYSGLESLKELLEKAHSEGRFYQVAMPHKIGSDRAGGDWRVVLAMIESLFAQSPIPVFIVKLPESS